MPGVEGWVQNKIMKKNYDLSHSDNKKHRGQREKS